MSEFSWMEVTFGKNLDESGGDFHSVKINDVHEGRLHDVVACFLSNGYEIVSVVVDGMNFLQEMSQHIAPEDLGDAFDIMCSFSTNVDAVVAFLHVRDSADILNWDDSILIQGSDHEDVVRGWTELFHKRYEEVTENRYDSRFVEAEVFPDWMATNTEFWRDSLDNIAQKESSDVVEFNDEVYYFG